MTPSTKAAVRSSTRVKPVVRSSASSLRQLQQSMRRLGVDEATIAAVAAAGNGAGRRAAR